MRCRFAVAAFALLTANDGAFADDRVRAVDDAAWLAPEADVVDFLLRPPGECLREPDDAETRYLVEVGRAAFRSPLLLGGTAARGGLSCNSCHRDGRGNPDFFLEGLSGDPGTADVTSSLFSMTRDDGLFNPVPIPTLVDVSEKSSFGDTAQAPSLHAFVSDIIVEEFQGAEPAETVLAGLAAYVKHLGSDACEDAPGAASARRDMEAAARALAAAESALARGDAAAADFLLLAAQRELGGVHRRFFENEKAQSRLESLARSVGAIRLVAEENPGRAQSIVAEKRAEAQRLARFLHKKRAKSLYDRAVLERRFAEP